MMTIPRKISIILLNWNGLNDTIECLESLFAIDYPNFEIIVVDNGSNGKDARALEEKYGRRIHLIKNKKNQGFAGGNNIGARYAIVNQSPDYLFFLNNDTEVDRNFLEPLIECMEKKIKIGIAGPKILWKQHPEKILFAGGKVNLFLGDAAHLGLFANDGPNFNYSKDVDYIEGSALFIRRSIAEKHGMFDEDFFAYWEDTDLCLRIQKAGYRCIFVPTSRIYHKVSQSTGGDESPISIYYMSRNRFRFMKKHARWFHLPSFFVFTLVWGARTLLRFAFKKNFRAIRTYLIGTLHGLKGVTGEMPQNLL